MNIIIIITKALTTKASGVTTPGTTIAQQH